jgi:hypothetical protein
MEIEAKLSTVKFLHKILADTETFLCPVDPDFRGHEARRAH